MTRRLLPSLLVVFTLFGCSEDVLPNLLTLRGPVDLGVVCIKGGAAAPMSDCTATEGTAYALILNAERGSIARLQLPADSSTTSTTAGFKDDSSFIPGISPTALGSRPTEPSRPVSIAVAADGQASYVANLATSNIARIDNTLLASDSAVDKGNAVSFQALPARPSDVIMRYPEGAPAGSSDEVLVALTDAAAVARVPVAGFGGHTSLDSITIPGGSPYDLVLFGDTLYVGHADVAFLSVVDLTTNSETGRISLSSPCFDDIDNNGDGLIDSADYGCRQDPMGAEAVMPAGAAPFNVVTLPTHDGLPACANGVDDDGDGATDFPDDPDCMSATSAYEESVPQPVRARLAISPDGTLLYATNARDRRIVAIDTAAGAPIDANAQCSPAANALLRRLGITGFQVPGVPLDVALAQRPDTTDPTDSTKTIRGALIGMVSAANGTVSLVESETDVDADGIRERVHRRLDANTDTAATPTLSTPSLFDAEGGVDLGQNRRPDYPSFGEFRQILSETVPAPGWTLDEPTPCAYPEQTPQRTETEVETWYGVALAPNERLAQRETWSITHEGVFLARTARFGAFTDPGTGAFETPESIYCTAGVEVGDTLIVHTPHGPACDSREEKAFKFTITAVTQQKLTVDPASGVAFLDAEGEYLERGTGAAIALSAACFPDAMAYDVRVPRKTYAVIGGESGYLHGWRVAADGSTCEKDPDADPRFVGRATEWTMKAGERLTLCPPENTEVNNTMEGEWFHNHAMSFRVIPGCQQQTTGAIQPIETEADVQWRFTVNSTYVPLTIANLGTPRSLRWVPSRDEVYATDAGQEKVVGIPTAEMTSSELIEQASRRTYR